MVCHAIGVASCVVKARAKHCPKGFDADHIGWVIQGREWRTLAPVWISRLIVQIVIMMRYNGYCLAPVVYELRANRQVLWINVTVVEN